MPTRMLSALGVGALVLVVALGVWGWSDHEASAARHAAALEAENQPQFCASLGFAIGQVTGQYLDPTLPVILPAAPPTEAMLLDNASFIEDTFRGELLPIAPPVLVDDVERVADAAAEVAATASTDPLRSGPVSRSLLALVQYWSDTCT